MYILLSLTLYGGGYEESLLDLLVLYNMFSPDVQSSLKIVPQANVDPCSTVPLTYET